MSTTSLKLSDQLKARAARIAKKRGITPHAFMVEAIDQAATLAERRAQFVEQALASRTAMLASGKGYSAAEVHAHLRARASGKKSVKPKLKPWRG